MVAMFADSLTMISRRAEDLWPLLEVHALRRLCSLMNVYTPPFEYSIAGAYASSVTSSGLINDAF